MADAVNDNTVLVVGSAPQYPQGVVDPIPEIAALAAEVGANFHVDACMGGFVLPFMEMLGATCRRGTSGSTASPRSRPTSTSSATRPRACR
jgi:glutamate/tyrosine decarboxylase-like PLP-dependent enzyme